MSCECGYFTDPVPCSGDGIMHDSDPTHPVLTKQRSNTTSNTEQNSIDATNASLQGRPRPKSVKINTGINIYNLEVKWKGELLELVYSWYPLSY